MVFEDQCRRSATKHKLKKGVNLTAFLTSSYPMTNFTRFNLLSHISVRTVMTALLIHFISVLTQFATKHFDRYRLLLLPRPTPLQSWWILHVLPLHLRYLVSQCLNVLFTALCFSLSPTSKFSSPPIGNHSFSPFPPDQEISANSQHRDLGRQTTQGREDDHSRPPAVQCARLHY